MWLLWEPSGVAWDQELTIRIITKAIETIHYDICQFSNQLKNLTLAHRPHFWTQTVHGSLNHHGGLSAVSRRTVRDPSVLRRNTRIAPNFDSPIIWVLIQIHQPNFNHSISSSLGTRSPKYFQEFIVQKQIGAPNPNSFQWWNPRTRVRDLTKYREDIVGYHD